MEDDMCGINGFTFPDRALIEAMNTRVKHRGPDGEGVFVDEAVSLGHTRLAILDLSERGAQPMSNQDKSIWIVFNGEIYNFQEIRDELRQKGFSFISGTDTEVIIHAYEAYGIDCIKKFNGMFSFALWDKKKQELFLVRDRVGIKPLYYYHANGKLIFSSEIKSILIHTIERRINKDALNMYLRLLYVASPLTMFDGINKLPSGHYLKYTNKKMEIVPYWVFQKKDPISYTEAVETLRVLMKDSVRYRRISDRPVGVFLSGGVDSTGILGLVSEQTSEKIKTFSVGFDIAKKKFNADCLIAKQTSTYYGTDHHELIISGKDCAEHLHAVVRHMDEPVANTTQIATYLLSQYTKSHVAVVLGGDGGDELFGGYERYRLLQMLSYYHRIPRAVRVSVFSPLLRRFFPHYHLDDKLDISDPLRQYLGFMAQKESLITQVLLAPWNDPQITLAQYEKRFSPPFPLDVPTQAMWTDLKSWLVDESLMRTDKMTMAFGLEQRVPLLDHRIIEFAFSLPIHYKIRGREGKRILKDALQPYVPPHVLEQPKRGWFSPTSEWMRTSLKELAHEVLSPTYNSGAAALFDFDTVETLLKDHMERRAYHMNMLWALITFQIWYREYLYEDHH